MSLDTWRPGATKDALLAFLDESEQRPVAERVAHLDNDGTLWCEKPTYVQLDFFIHVLGQRASEDPSLRDRPEFAAVLSGDFAKITEFGLDKVAMALASLFEGQTPEEYVAAVREFAGGWRHRTLDRPLAGITYAPMLELIDELRAREFTVCIVTGGGTEFVRAIGTELYGVIPELVVGSLIEHEFVPGDRPSLRRTSRILGSANEGAPKVVNIQNQLGRRALLAAGNSGGDTEMLAWTAAGGGLALVVDHDDEEREFAYAGSAASFAEAESLVDTAHRLGWVVASMRDDWEQVFRDV